MVGLRQPHSTMNSVSLGNKKIHHREEKNNWIKSKNGHIKSLCNCQLVTMISALFTMILLSNHLSGCKCWVESNIYVRNNWVRVVKMVCNVS